MDKQQPANRILTKCHLIEACSFYVAPLGDALSDVISNHVRDVAKVVDPADGEGRPTGERQIAAARSAAGKRADGLTETVNVPGVDRKLTVVEGKGVVK